MSWRPQPAADLPDRLILFDGVCVLCSYWARFVMERDCPATFRFVTVQERRGREIACRFGIDPEAPQTNVVIIDKRAYFKSDAALAILACLPRWRWVRVLRWLPRPLRDRVYDMVARNRYRWFGRSEVCLLPGPDTAARFLPDPG